MKHINAFTIFLLNENLNIKPISNKIYTQKEMVQMGGNYHLHHGILAMIPVEEIDGLDPEPTTWSSEEEEGKPFTPNQKIYKPIEVKYESGKYMLYDGNHRVKQAKVNGDKYIKAFVQANDKKTYDLFFNI